MSNAAVINATSTSGQTAGTPISIETGGDVVLKAYGTGSGNWFVVMAFAPVVNGVTGAPVTLTIDYNQPGRQTSAVGTSATEWVGWVLDQGGTWQASGIVEGYQPGEAQSGDLGPFASFDALPQYGVKSGARASVNGVQYTYSAGAGWVGANPTKLDRYLRIATFGDSTANISGVGNTNTEKQYFGMPTGSAGYAIDSSKATVKDQCRCIYVGSGGISGQSTQQFIDRGKVAYSATRKAMQDVVSALPDVIQMHGGSINDYSGFTASTPQATIDAVVSRHRQCVEFFTGCGINVVDPGTYGFATPGANLSAICAIIVQTNAALKTLAAQNPLWHFVDVSGVLHDGTGLYKAGVSSDNVHLNGYGGYLLGTLEKQVLDTLFISGTGGKIIYDAQADFANYTENLAPANWSVGYNAGKTTINSRKCEAGVFTIDCTLNAADDVTAYIDVPTLFAGASVGDALALEYDISVYDYASGEKIPAQESTRITIKDAANTNMIYYEAASAVLIGPKVMQMSIPIAPGSFGTQSQFWNGAKFPGAGRYLIKFKPTRLRKYNVLTA